MASEPKRRHSKARKRVRRAAITAAYAVKLAINFVTCKNCGKPTLPHIVCKECGFYGGKAPYQTVQGKEKVKVIKA